MDYVAIDFETANKYMNSACSVGLVKFKGGKIVEEYYSLIKPPIMSFDAMNIQIHGIRPADVRNAPCFKTIWKDDMVDFIEGLPLAAHYASFDMNVLRALFKTYEIESGSLRYICTVSVARKIFPELENHRLSTVAAYLGLSLNHHQALDDARACGNILARAFDMAKVDSFEDLCIQKGMCLKIF